MRLRKNIEGLSDLEKKSISLRNALKVTTDGIPKPVSQGEYGAKVEEDGGMEKALSELKRGSEENGRNAQTSGGTVSGREEVESRIAERYAKANGIWIPMEETFSLGEPAPSGNENDVYFNSEENSVYKVNNLMNSGNISSLLERLKLHNQYFPDTKYELAGFTGFGNGNVYPVLRQRYVETTPSEIDNYMEALGFEKIGEAKYSNGEVIISDLRPRNVLRDSDNDYYVVDAEFEKIKSKPQDDTGKSGSPLFRDGEAGKEVGFDISKPVEQSRNLVAVHNLSGDKLKQALELGGFPMPSVAITKADVYRLIINCGFLHFRRIGFHSFIECRIRFLKCSVNFRFCLLFHPFQLFIIAHSFTFSHSLRTFCFGRNSSLGGIMLSDSFDLGLPSSNLRAAGVQNKPIYMKQSVLREHLKKHGISVSEIKNLPKALQRPMMVYEWGSKAKSLVVVTEVSTNDGRNVSVAIKLERNGNRLDVNEIASVHGKEVERFLSDMANAQRGGLKEALRYVEKSKVLEWFAMAPPKGASQTVKGLTTATKIVENFENPTLEDGEIVSAVESLADELNVLVRIVRNVDEIEVRT